MQSTIYFDNNATTSLLPEVRDAIGAAAELDAGNPSSSHSAGERARDLISRSRESVAALVNACADSIVFTSGATETNNMVLRSVLTRGLGKSKARIVTTAVEHSSILRTCEYLQSEGVEIVILPVDRFGLIDLEELSQALSHPASLVSVQWANNETGVVQQISEIGEICRDRGVIFHVDAAQAIGKSPVDLSQTPVDFVSLTAHKIHGPSGIGAVYVRDLQTLRPFVIGGLQESGLRGGTENLLGIAGFGVAAKMRRAGFSVIEQRLRSLRDRFETAIVNAVPGVSVNGAGATRLANSTNLQFTGIDGQAFVARLDQAGIICSQSSACTNHRPEPSYVLRAMGLSETEAYASVRFSFSELNEERQIDAAVPVIADLCGELRTFAARRRNPYARAAGVA